VLLDLRPEGIDTNEERKCDEKEQQNTDRDGNVAEFCFHDRTSEGKTGSQTTKFRATV